MSYSNPTQIRRWSQVIRKGGQFILH
jgi:hypothetical protein